MKKTCLFIAFFTIQTLIYAQVNSQKNYLYLYPDSILYGRDIQLKKPLFGSSYFIIDSNKVKPELVKFYANEKGVFANEKDLIFGGNSAFSERISEGKINLYEKVSTRYTPSGFGSNGMYMSTPSKVIKNYYNIGYGDLKKATYKNLSIDLADNAESMVFMDKFKSNTKTQTILYGVGGVAILSGIISFISKSRTIEPVGSRYSSKPQVTGSVVLLGAGVACFWGNYFISLSKPKHLKSAIDAYNY